MIDFESIIIVTLTEQKWFKDSIKLSRNRLRSPGTQLREDV